MHKLSPGCLGTLVAYTPTPFQRSTPDRSTLTTLPWTLCVLLHLDIRITILCPCYYEAEKLNLKMSDIFKVRSKHKQFHLRYLNRITNDTCKSAFDHGPECSIFGPDIVLHHGDLPDNVSKYIYNVKQRLTPIYHAQNPTMNAKDCRVASSPPSFINHIHASKQRNGTYYESTSKDNSTTYKVHEPLDDDDILLEDCFAFPIATPIDDGTREYAFLKNEHSKTLLRRQSIPVREYNNILRETATKIIQFKSLHVDEFGIDIEVDTSLNAGSFEVVKENTGVDPYERKGIIHGHWSIEKDSFSIKKPHLFSTLLEHVFGDFNFNRSCGGCEGMNVYTGHRDCDYVRANPRMSQQVSPFFQYFRQSWDVTFLPLVLKMVQSLVKISTYYQTCNNRLFDLFQKRCMTEHSKNTHSTTSRQSTKHNYITSMNRHSNLNIITYCNSKLSGFSNNPHYDFNDIWSEEHMQVATELLQSLFDKRDTTTTSESFLKCLRHLDAMSISSVRNKFSNLTTCGYHLVFQGVASKVMYIIAAFIYLQSRISVNIPENTTSFHTFGGAMERHLTPVPILVCNDIVHFNDPRLSVFAWGGARSPARVYIEQNNGTIAGNRITHQDIRDFYGNATDQQRQYMRNQNWIRPGQEIGNRRNNSHSTTRSGSQAQREVREQSSTRQRRTLQASNVQEANTQRQSNTSIESSTTHNTSHNASTAMVASGITHEASVKKRDCIEISSSLSNESDDYYEKFPLTWTYVPDPADIRVFEDIQFPYNHQLPDNHRSLTVSRKVCPNIEGLGWHYLYKRKDDGTFENVGDSNPIFAEEIHVPYLARTNDDFNIPSDSMDAVFTRRDDGRICKEFIVRKPIESGIAKDLKVGDIVSHFDKYESRRFTEPNASIQEELDTELDINHEYNWVVIRA